MTRYEKLRWTHSWRLSHTPHPAMCRHQLDQCGLGIQLIEQNGVIMCFACRMRDRERILEWGRVRQPSAVQNCRRITRIFFYRVERNFDYNSPLARRFKWSPLYLLAWTVIKISWHFSVKTTHQIRGAKSPKYPEPQGKWKLHLGRPRRMQVPRSSTWYIYTKAFSKNGHVREIPAETLTKSVPTIKIGDDVHQCFKQITVNVIMCYRETRNNEQIRIAGALKCLSSVCIQFYTNDFRDALGGIRAQSFILYIKYFDLDT